MRVPIFHLDAFTTRTFAGNPAAAMLMERFPDDGLLTANRSGEQPCSVKTLGNERRPPRPLFEIAICDLKLWASSFVS